MPLDFTGLLAVLLFAGVILWLLRNAEARMLVRELSRYGLYLLASAIQNGAGIKMGYVQRYRDSVARDTGLKKDSVPDDDGNSVDPHE